MRRSHAMPLRITKQHGQAVGHHHGTGQPDVRGDGTIRLHAVWRLRVDGGNVHSMHLV